MEDNSLLERVIAFQFEVKSKEVNLGRYPVIDAERAIYPKGDEIGCIAVSEPTSRLLWVCPS
jgi:hypothetical protein